MEQKQILVSLLGLGLVACSFLIVATAAAPQQAAATCNRELHHANRTLSKWAETMEQMVSESNLASSIRDSIHSEANTILDLIEDFGVQVGRQPAGATQAPSSLVRELITIRRRSNRMALDIYLNTFDMRWPQNSLQLSVIVERVQQACLDRATITALESPPNPLEPLV